MDAAERKQRIADIITTINEALSDMTDDANVVRETLGKAYELNQSIEEMGIDVDGWDYEEFAENIENAYIFKQLDPVRTSLDDFKSELDDYMCDLSDSRREKLEEKYAPLDDLLDGADYTNYSAIGDAVEFLNDAIEELKGMK